MLLNKNVKIAVGLFVAVIVWMLTGFFKSEEEVVQKKAVVPTVFVQKIDPLMFTPAISLVGRTEVSKDVDVVAEVSGKVEKINFSQGDTVKKGDVLLVLENGYRKDNMDAAKQGLKTATLKLDIAKNLERQAYKAKTELADRESEYSNAVSLFTNAKRDYENSFVKSPLDGYIESKSVDLGDYVADDAMLYKIIDQQELLIVGFLSQNQRSKVKLGQKAYGIFDDGRKAYGEITFISQQSDEITKTYRVEITVKAKSDEFKVVEGLTMQIKIPTPDLLVYQIPHSSMVIADDGKVGIRTINESNIVVFTQVELIQDNQKHLLIVAADDSVLNLITRGQIDVQADMEVKVSYSDEIKK